LGFGIAAVAAIAFVLVQLRVDSPMLQLRLFQNPGLTVGVVTGIMTFICLSATFLLLPFYLSEVLGMDVLAMGFLLGVAPLMMGVVSPMAGTLSDRTGVRAPAVAGLLILSSVYFAFLSLGVHTTWWHFAALALPYGIGIGLFQSPTNSAIMGGVPAEYMGVAGGLLHLTRLMGQIVGIAVLGSIWAARIAVASGGSLPEGGATAAPAAAQVAGLHTVFVVAGVIMLAAAAIAAWGLRRES
jgi:MFS family permease